MKCQSFRYGSHAHAIISLGPVYFFVNSARNSGVNAWRTRATSPIKISETGYLSCYRNLPRSVRDTFLRCEMHTFRPSSTSIRRRGERVCVCACRLTEIVPSSSLLPLHIFFPRFGLHPHSVHRRGFRSFRGVTSYFCQRDSRASIVTILA